MFLLHKETGAAWAYAAPIFGKASCFARRANAYFPVAMFWASIRNLRGSALGDRFGQRAIQWKRRNVMILVRKKMVAAIMLFSLCGCVSAAKTVVTAPFKATGKIIDWSTTSQEEADRNRGRAMRERDERLEKLNKQRAKAERKCRQGQPSQCQRAEILSHEMDALLAQTV